MLVTSYSSIHTKVHFEKHIIIRTIITRELKLVKLWCLLIFYVILFFMYVSFALVWTYLRHPWIPLSVRIYLFSYLPTLYGALVHYFWSACDKGKHTNHEVSQPFQRYDKYVMRLLFNVHEIVTNWISAGKYKYKIVCEFA